MSKKVLDKKNRWRNKIVAFRVSPEEAELLNRYVGLSGLSKQDYLISKVLCWEISVQVNSRIQKALKNELRYITQELQKGKGVDDDELIELIKHVLQIIVGTKGEDQNDGTK